VYLSAHIHLLFATGHTVAYSSLCARLTLNMRLPAHQSPQAIIFDTKVFREGYAELKTERLKTLNSPTHGLKTKRLSIFNYQFSISEKAPDGRAAGAFEYR
jgi:hypothetical protein